MASAAPIEQQQPDRTARIATDHRRVRLLVVCALLALVAVLMGMLLGAGRHGNAGAASADRAVVATPLPNMPTPTPLANKPPTIAPTMPAAPTAPPPPTAMPPTSVPPVVAAPLAQPAPANVAPGKPHDDGKGKGKGKG